MVVQHKCPSCGADMVFDSKSGKLTCESCGKEEVIEKDSSDASSEEDLDEVFGDFEDFIEETSQNTYADSEATQYQCKNCGATLITNEDTVATNCSFCGSPMILGDRLAGSLAPSKVIPFTISKQQAQEAFRKWCKKGLLTPKNFMTADRIKNISGMYIPYWLYDLNGRGEVNATCTKVRVYERGDYIYTETKYYDVYRKVDLNYNKIPADASEKMDDHTMDKLEPFHYQNLKEFNTPYLAGFLAEKYNYTDRQLFPRIQQRAEQYVRNYIQSTIHGYSSTTITNQWIDIKQRKAEYALLPVWMICYDYKRSEHNFYMNGQTGKIIGKPPLSIGKVILWWILFTTIIFILLTIITYFT